MKKESAFLEVCVRWLFCSHLIIFKTIAKNFAYFGLRILWNFLFSPCLKFYAYVIKQFPLALLINRL